MLNGVNLNYFIVLMVTGAVLLAAIYHTILYLHRRTKMLQAYSAYLWTTFLYCGFRSVYFFDSGSVLSFINLDEVLQMIAFIFYIRFGATVFALQKHTDKFAFYFAVNTPVVVLTYLTVNSYLVNFSESETLYLIAKISVRVYLLCIGFFMLLVIVGRRRSVFFRYLAAGMISIILCGLISSVLNVFAPDHFVLGAISWLMFGFFLDVIFFSAAIGFQIKTEHDEKEESLKELLKKEAELQQREMERFRVN